MSRLEAGDNKREYRDIQDSQSKKLLTDENQIILDFSGEEQQQLEIEDDQSQQQKLDETQKQIKFKKLVEKLTSNDQLIGFYLEIVEQQESNQAQKEQENVSIFFKIFSCLQTKPTLNTASLVQ